MRAQAFENILRQPVFWFDLKSSSPGNLVTKLARDAPLVKSVSILSQRGGMGSIISPFPKKNELYELSGFNLDSAI